MTNLDWFVVGLYVLSAVGIGAYFTKKAAQSTSDFFVAGRSLSWFVAGTSIVATTFSADTPLFVAGMSRELGISSNWYWWSAAIGQIASVFFFARLWRRTEVLTDIEFLVKRYDSGKATSMLRVFKVFLDGIVINCIAIASVTLAMSKIIKVMLNLSDKVFFTLPVIGGVNSTTILLFILGGAAVLYSVMSGLYGVVYTDLIQFSLAIFGSIGLAVIVYIDASSGHGMMEKLAASPDFKESLLNFFPKFHTFDLMTFTFFIYIFMVWWSVAPGNGYIVQRLLATKSEKDSMLAFMWYNICHYIIRPWPWILVGILSLHYFPNLEDAETCFPNMINMFLPAGLKGVMVASLLAAFMSTIDTQLNWGASYFVNDFYRPFINKNADSKKYVLISRLSMVALIVVAFIITSKLTSILGAYKYITVIAGGLGTVMIARWYWWRVNTYSEITAIISSFIVGNIVAVKLASTPERDLFAVRLIINVTITTISWVVVTLITSKKPSQKAIEFYSKMRIAGPGWKAVNQITGIQPRKGELLNSFIAWITCVALLLSLLLAIGKFLFYEWGHGLAYMAVFALSLVILIKYVKKMSFD